MIAGLQQGETLLVHGGAGGIGTFAIQLAHALGARVVTTAGSPEKLDVCRSLGADVTINYQEQDFVEEVQGRDRRRGADVILDNMGAKYLSRNVDALATEGRLVVIGMQGGSKGELDLGALMRKRGAVIATSLRARPGRGEGRDLRVGRRARLAARRRRVREDRSCTPRCRSRRPREAHRIMEASDHIGKIVLTSS